MKYKTVAEAFNHYRNETLEAIEKRAGEIKGTIQSDPNADMISMNIELSGLYQAKQNLMDKTKTEGSKDSLPQGGESQRSSGFQFIEGMETAKPFKSDDVLGTPEYRSAFFKNLLGQHTTPVEDKAFKAGIRESERRSSAFNSTSNTSAILPTQTLNEIISKARTMGGLISECRSFNMPTGISVPVSTPASKASWHTEGAEADTDKANIAAVTFSGYEIIKLFSISVKAQKMSIASFESYLITELTNCVMECIADALVNGTGTEQGTGILKGITWNATNGLTFSKANGLKYADVVKVVAALPRGYANGAKWAMNNAALYNLFYGLEDTTGRPIFISDPKAESIGKILGFDVVIDDNLPDETVLFGNFQYIGYNMPGGIMLDTSKESSFKSGLIDYRAMAIADCKPIVTEAFIKLTRAAA